MPAGHCRSSGRLTQTPREWRWLSNLTFGGTTLVGLVGESKPHVEMSDRSRPSPSFALHLNVLGDESGWFPCSERARTPTRRDSFERALRMRSGDVRKLRSAYSRLSEIHRLRRMRFQFQVPLQRSPETGSSRWSRRFGPRRFPRPTDSERASFCVTNGAPLTVGFGRSFRRSRSPSGRFVRGTQQRLYGRSAALPPRGGDIGGG